MNSKLLILVLLGISLVFFGCTKRTSGGNETLPQVDAPEAVPDAGEPVEEPGGPSAHAGSEKGLPELFNISTEQPLADEGLESESPSAE